jgi:hypothetical protein
VINQNEGISKAPHQHTIPKRDVEIDCIEILIFCAVEEPTLLCLRNRCIRTKLGRELATINPRTITTHLEEMLVVAELATTHDSV